MPYARFFAIPALLLGSLSLHAQPHRFDDGAGAITVYAMPFGDAVGRVITEVETPAGALFSFETLVTLNRVSLTAFVDDGFVALTENCGGLRAEAGSGTLHGLSFHAPELQTWTAKSGTVRELRFACGACSSGNSGACRACAGYTISAYVGAGQCLFDPQGGGSDNGDHGIGSIGGSPACRGFDLMGGGSDNGDHGTGSASHGTTGGGTGSASHGTTGGGSDNGDHGTSGGGSDNGDHGTGSTASGECNSSGLLGGGSDNGDHGTGDSGQGLLGGGSDNGDHGTGDA